MKRRSFLHRLGGSATAAWMLSETRAAAPQSRSSVHPAKAIPKFGDGRDWFLEKRFGMFVHWGIYSLAGWHEQHQWRGRVPRKEYVKLASKWNPVKFDPERWLDLLGEAGMRYLTVTTKHHDGFCLFESKLTDFNSARTPYGKDIIGMLSQACQKRGIPLCLYYSIADWHHPNYPNQGRHHELAGPEDGDRPDWDAYMDFLKGQIRELCTNYGKIHGIWWDMNVPKHVDPSVNAMIRSLQPDAVINDRGFDPGDFGTPERDYDTDSARAFEKRVEACQAVGSESWGYRTDEDYHTVGHLERSIARYLARGANYLLNVGPKPDGEIDARSASILREIGGWMRHVGEAYGDSEPVSHFTNNPNVLLTRRGNSPYVHLHTVPSTDAVKLKPFTTAPKSAVLLNDGRLLSLSTSLCPADHESRTGYLRIRGLPSDAIANTAAVIRLDFEQWPPAASEAKQQSEPHGLNVR